MRKSRFVVCLVLLLNMFLTAQQNYMNSVERGMWDSYNGRATIFICSPDTVVQYSQGDLIPQEAPHEIADTKPGVTWPEHGSIEFNNITMSYRPGLPKVLKGISMSIKGGEKIGVVGRLGFFLLRRKWHSTVTPGPELERVRSCWHYSGSSNWTQGASQLTGQCENTWLEIRNCSWPMFRVDISRIGLTDLRSKVSIIPQDVRSTVVRHLYTKYLPKSSHYFSLALFVRTWIHSISTTMFASGMHWNGHTW